MNVRTLGHMVFLCAGLAALSLVRCTATTTSSHPVYHLPPAVNNILTTDQITILANMGMTINNGTTPPSIVGSYYVDALLLTGSNVPGDSINVRKYANYSYRFSNQTAAGNISVERAIEGGTSTGFGQGAIISGSGYDFSIFTDLTDSIVSDSLYHHIIIFKSARIISGTWSAAGIAGFRYAFICTGKVNDIADEEIEVDQGRVIWESDNIADFVTYYPFAKIMAGPGKAPDDIRR